MLWNSVYTTIFPVTAANMSSQTSTALKLRSEDGRFIKDVDISLFINDLPNKKDTRCFSTEDASGSTSQAAGIVEGMEAGSRVFLLDEDTSATNFHGA